MFNCKFILCLCSFVDYEVECWAPAHFTSSHRVYTNHVCRCQLERGAGFYVPFDEEIPDPYQTPQTIKNHRNNFKFLLPIECAVAICSWAIIHHCTGLFIIRRYGDAAVSQSALTSGFQFLCYSLVLLMIALVWVAMALVSYFSTGQSEDTSVILCDYKVFSNYIKFFIKQNDKAILQSTNTHNLPTLSSLLDYCHDRQSSARSGNSIHKDHNNE